MTPSLARVDTSTWLLLAATILVLAAGQVLFKFAANGLQLDQPRSFISVSLLNSKLAGWSLARRRTLI